MDYIFFLDEIPESKHALSMVGGKAYNLARLKQAGFLIPPGFCLTVSAFYCFWEAKQLHEDKELIDARNEAGEIGDERSLREKFEDAGLPGNLSRAVREAYKRLTKNDLEMKVAIRSSGRMEDGKNYSFAGQYDTLLDIRGVEELETGIRKVWASLSLRRASAYTSHFGSEDQDISMPVLVQQMVFPDLSGTAFSINPLNGASEIVIEAVPGLGAALVSGEQTPERYRLEKQTLKISEFVPGEHGTALLSEEKVQTISDLVLKAERFFGCPQDVEWALSEGNLYLLQSRPVTALSQASVLVEGQVDMEALLNRSDEMGSEIWTDDNVGEVFPEAVTPLTWSVLEPLGNKAFKNFLRNVGIKTYPNSGLFGRFFGRIYFNQTQFQRLMNRYYPSRLNRSRRNFMGYIRAASALGWSAARSLFLLPILPIISRRLAGRTKLDIQQLRDPKKIPVDELLEEIENWRQKEEKLMEVHLSITIFALLLYSLFDKILMVWSRGQVETAYLTTGLPGMKSAEIGEDLAALAAKALEEPDLTACLLDAPLEELVGCLDSISKTGSFWQDFTVFINKHGHASEQEFELAYPRWRDEPIKVLGLLRTHLQSEKKGVYSDLHIRQQLVRAQAEKEIGRRLGLSIKQGIFLLLRKLVQNYSVERENLKYFFVEAHGQLRQMYLVLAEKMVIAGQLMEPEDIFFLTHQEIISLHKTNISPGEAWVRMYARRKEYNSQVEMGESAPRLLEQKQDGSWQPLVAAEVSKEKSREVVDEDATRILQGVAASAGLFTGRARVISDQEETVHLKPGEILVTRSTNPSWSPLFINAGALVTEIGGLLSHGAIVAREYGLPAVLNVKGITAVVKTGQILTVDGYRGVVKISDSNGHEPAL
jgi:rifampicin phosphotransferase